MFNLDRIAIPLLVSFLLTLPASPGRDAWTLSGPDAELFNQSLGNGSRNPWAPPSPSPCSSPCSPIPCSRTPRPFSPVDWPGPSPPSHVASTPNCLRWQQAHRHDLSPWKH